MILGAILPGLPLGVLRTPGSYTGLGHDDGGCDFDNWYVYHDIVLPELPPGNYKLVYNTDVIRRIVYPSASAAEAKPILAGYWGYYATQGGSVEWGDVVYNESDGWLYWNGARQVDGSDNAIRESTTLTSPSGKVSISNGDMYAARTIGSQPCRGHEFSVNARLGNGEVRLHSTFHTRTAHDFLQGNKWFYLMHF